MGLTQSGARLDLLFQSTVFPVDPRYVEAFKIGADGSTNRWEEFIFAEYGQKAKSLEFVFDRIFELGEAQLNSDVKQRLI